MATKKLTSKEKLQIIIALIGTVGVLGTAIIAIIPQIFENNEEPITQIETSTPVMFNRYDDITDLLSIEYPSYFIIESRDVVDDYVVIHFYDIEQYGNHLTIVASRNSSGYSTREELEAQISQILDKKLDSNEEKYKLLSTKKTDRGYLLHSLQVQENGNPISESYDLTEAENDIFVFVMLEFDSESSYKYSNEVIERIFFSFTWSYDELDKQLK